MKRIYCTVVGYTDQEQSRDGVAPGVYVTTSRERALELAVADVMAKRSEDPKIWAKSAVELSDKLVVECYPQLKGLL